MFKNYSIYVRLFIVIGISIAVFLDNISYKETLILMSLVYLFLYILTSPEIEERSWLKYIFLIIDMIFISIMIYLTGLSYLSVFIIPIISDFINDKKEIVYFLLSSLIPIGTSLYISNFSDFLFIPLILSGISGALKLKALVNKKEKELRKLKEEAEEVYIQNIKLQDRLEETKKILDTLNLLRELQEEKITLKQFVYILKDILDADDIVFFDYLNSKCISTDKIKCDKSIIKHIKDNPQTFTDSPINEKFNSEYIVSLVLEKEEVVLGVLFIIYKLKPKDSKLIYKLIIDCFKII